MATAVELMGLGMAGGLAGAIGQGAIANLTPSGSGQSAAQIVSAATILTTASALAVLLPSAGASPIIAIYNNSGNAQTLTGKGADTVNSGTTFSLSSAKSAICVPGTTGWIVTMSA